MCSCATFEFLALDSTPPNNYTTGINTPVGCLDLTVCIYQLVTMCVCFCVFVRFLDMNYLVCLSIMNCLVN
jgi:hypothetical protein